MTPQPHTDPATDADMALTERIAHHVLALVAAMPGTMGRLRVARAIGGYSLSGVDPATVDAAQTYALASNDPSADLSLRTLVEMVDALLAGGLMAQTVGQRPTLVLTRMGFRALEALGEPTPREAASDA